MEIGGLKTTCYSLPNQGVGVRREECVGSKHHKVSQPVKKHWYSNLHCKNHKHSLWTQISLSRKMRYTCSKIDGKIWGRDSITRPNVLTRGPNCMTSCKIVNSNFSSFLGSNQIVEHNETVLTWRNGLSTGSPSFWWRNTKINYVRRWRTFSIKKQLSE